MDASDFELTPALDAEIERAATLLSAARSVVALTGAGLSVESGIPPFRGPGGLLTRFGEPIPPDVLRACYGSVEQCDCMLVIGTTATVYPAAEFPFEVLRRGGPVIEVNPHESELTAAATLSLTGPGGTVLPRLVHHVERRRSRGGRS